MSTLLDGPYTTQTSSVADTPFTASSFDMTVYLVSQDAVSNTSLIEIRLRAKVSSADSGDAVYGNIYFNGSISYNFSKGVSSSGTYTMTTQQYTVNHNADGSGSFNCRIRGRVRSYLGDYGAYKYSVTPTISLPTIPRVSTITAPVGGFSYIIGDNLTVNITKANSSYTDNLTIKIAGITIKTIEDFTSSTIEFDSTEIEAMYNALPDSSTGTIEVIFETFNGSTSFGTASKTGTVNVTNSNPIFSNCSYSDINTATVALTGDNQILIQDNSTVRVTISVANAATAQNGASMASYNVIIGTKQNSAVYSETEDVNIDIENAPSAAINVYAVDSRGLQTLVALSATLIEYYNPIVANAAATRENDVDETTYVKLAGTFKNIDFGVTVNSLTATYKYKTTDISTYTDGTSPITISLNSDNWDIGNAAEQSIIGDIAGSGFDSTKSFDIQFTLTDELNSTTVEFELKKGKPIMHITPDGIAFFKVYEEGNGSLDVEGDGRFSGAIYEGGQTLASKYSYSYTNPASICAFRAYRSSDYTESNGDVIQFNATLFNTGNTYNTSTKKFTAPVDGLYQISVHVMAANPTDKDRYGIDVYKNGSTRVMTARDYASGGNYAIPDATTLIELDAGDYLQCKANFESTEVIKGTYALSWFSGHLIRDDS